MRILHLLGVGRLSPTPDGQALSGITRTVLSLARIQATNGHEVSIATPDTSKWSAEWEGVHLFGVPPIPWARVRLGRMSIDYRTHAAITVFTARRHFDVIQGHNYPYFRLIRAPRRIVTFHGDPLHYGWTSKDFAVCQKYGTHFVAVSDFVSSIVSRELKIPKASVPVVHNGVDHNLFETSSPEIVSNAKDWRDRLGISNHQVVFLYAGAISDEKGTRELALAFRGLLVDVPNAVLIIAGSSHIWGRSGDERKKTTFEDDVHDILVNCKENVRFLKNILGSEMPTVYAMADAVVVPSTVKEGFGLVALESISCGRPVIASCIGGLPEIVDSRCGILVEPGNVQMLCRAMEDLAKHPDIRTRKGKYGAQKARKFSWERGVNILDEIYQS